MASKRLGMVLAIFAIVVTSLTHLATERSYATDVVFHLAMLVVLLAGLALVVRHTHVVRERGWSMLLLVLWGLTSVRYVAWLGVLAIVAGLGAMAAVFSSDA